MSLIFIPIYFTSNHFYFKLLPRHTLFFQIYKRQPEDTSELPSNYLYPLSYTIPCAVIASTTFSKPAILAPTT